MFPTRFSIALATIEPDVQHALVAIEPGGRGLRTDVHHLAAFHLRAEEREKSFQQSAWGWRAPGDFEIDGDRRGRAADTRVAAGKESAGNSAIADGDHPFRSGHGIV